jgi:hypothetical protein
VLENILVFIAVPLIVILGRYLKLSETSYTLITIFMILHVIGSHYTYAEVPFGDTLKTWFGEDRNMYDRLVHFSFGLLLAYPVREVFMRLSDAKGFWSYYFPIDLVGALCEVLGNIGGHEFMPGESEYSIDRNRPTLRGVTSNIYYALVNAGAKGSPRGEVYNYVQQVMSVNRVEFK